MRHNVKDFVGIVSESFSITEPVYEFGSLQVTGQEGFADLRPLFQGRQYVGADMREGPGVDRVLDLHSIDLPPESVGTVLCLDTLEHVEHPHRAMEEVFRILRPDGIAVISSVMKFPIHDYPFDYWRFTPEAFKSILKPFAGSFVGFAGEQSFPHTIVGIGFKGREPAMAEFLKAYGEWHRRQVIHASDSGFKRTVKLLTPPLVHPLLGAIYRALVRPR